MSPVVFRPADGVIDTAIPTSVGGFVRKAYRGELGGFASGGALVVTKTVAMEDYLRSVVPNEVAPAWPTEALWAQAPAARTTLCGRLDRSGQSFHVYDSTRSQGYPGMRPYDDQWNPVHSYKDGRTEAMQATDGRSCSPAVFRLHAVLVV